MGGGELSAYVGRSIGIVAKRKRFGYHPLDLPCSCGQYSFKPVRIYTKGRKEYNATPDKLVRKVGFVYNIIHV